MIERIGKVIAICQRQLAIDRADQVITLSAGRVERDPEG